uniref:Uncharacterized protein n=1 Tax=Megaselia scalaris TaxID=36166 RepID=T1GWG0_MEGSC
MMYEYVARPIRSALKRRIDTVQPYYYEKQTDIDFSTEHETTTPDETGITFPEDNEGDGLFSGSVQTQSTDESANAPSEDSDSESNGNRANDGYQEAIPGPVTRLVVLANRGLANLVQDLILVSLFCLFFVVDEFNGEKDFNWGFESKYKIVWSLKLFESEPEKICERFMEISKIEIFRIAATSERLVNFKAKVITALI